MKTSAIVMATSDDAVKEILVAAAWAFDEDGQSRCSACGTPTVAALPAARKRYR